MRDPISSEIHQLLIEIYAGELSCATAMATMMVCSCSLEWR